MSRVHAVLMGVCLLLPLQQLARGSHVGPSGLAALFFELASRSRQYSESGGFSWHIPFSLGCPCFTGPESLLQSTLNPND